MAAITAVVVRPYKADGRVRPTSVVVRLPGPLSTRVVVSNWTFCAVWWTVLALHVFCGGFVAALAALHAFVAQPEMYAYLFVVLQIPKVFLHSGAGAFCFLAASHFAVALRMIYLSIHQRHLAFVRLHSRRRIDSASALFHRPRSLRQFFRLCLVPAATIYRLWRHLFGVDGTFGLNGKHFDSVFFARESVEILSQLYQTYQLSGAVASAWINRFAVAAVVLNSVSSPCVRAICRSLQTRSATRRLATVVADLTLDFCGSFVVPMWILRKLVSEFDWANNVVPPQLVYSDVWVANGIAETRQLLITSSLDLVSSLALHLGVVGALLTVAADIRRELPTETPNKKDVNGADKRRPGGQQLCQARKSVVDMSPRARSTRFVHSLIELCFIGCGVVVLVTHLESQRLPHTVPECLLHVDSWFATKFPCSVVRFHCRPRDRAEEDIASLLALLDPSVLTAVVVSHCAEPVVVPRRLNDFAFIRQLKFVNVSSIIWEDGVEIDELHHPRLGYILFGYTNMSSIPAVLLHDRLPHMLRELEWSHSNLSALPSDLDRYWGDREWFAISFDHTPLAQLPPRFYNIRVQALWLVDNRLEQIDSKAFNSPSLQKIVLSANPLRQLPSDVKNVSPVLREVYVEHTMVDTVPDWLNRWLGQKSSAIFSASGSVLCASTGSTAPSVMASASTRCCAKNFWTVCGTIDWEFAWMYQKEA